LCLPFYGEMGLEAVDRVVDILRYIHINALERRFRSKAGAAE